MAEIETKDYKGPDRRKPVPIHPNRWRAISVWIVVFTVVVILMNVNQRHQSDKLKQQNAEIQKSRRDAVFTQCSSQNQRHDNTITELDELLSRAEAHVSPQRRVQLEASRESTVLLINALVPKQDCNSLVKRLVNQD